MDYLPVPRNATEDIAVPFLTTFQYDSQGLENFPERHGYAHDGDRAYLNLGPEHLASLLQSWLYFGLLTEYLDDPIDIEDFRSLASQAGSGTVTASLLPGFLQCHEDREHDSVSRKRSRKARKDALRIVRSLEDLVPSVSPVAEVFLSIQLLVWSIHASTSNVQIPKLRSKFLQSRMKDSGWCPYQADQVCRKYNLHVVYYLSRLVRHNPHAISHVPCTLDGCKANNVDEDHYQIRHTKIGCTCDFVRVSTTKVEDIIRTGGIPLISIEAQSHGKNRMKVIEATSRSKYVAVRSPALIQDHIH